MSRYASFSLRALLGLSLVLTMVATSQARLFGAVADGLRIFSSLVAARGIRRYGQRDCTGHGEHSSTPARCSHDGAGRLHGVQAGGHRACSAPAAPAVYPVAQPVVSALYRARRHAHIPTAALVSRPAAPGTLVGFHRIPGRGLVSFNRATVHSPSTHGPYRSWPERCPAAYEARLHGRDWRYNRAAKPPARAFRPRGGKPLPGCEDAAISDIAQLYMRRDFRHIQPGKSRVMLLDGGDRILASYPADLSAKAEAELRNLGVEVHTKTHVTRLARDGSRPTARGLKPPSRSGPRASRPRRWAKCSARSGVKIDQRGCVLVDDKLNPAGLREVFVLGDLAHFEQDGHQVPGVAQPAMQMGDHVAKLIAADLAGSAAPRLPLLRQGRHGHHRPHGRHRRCEVAVQSAHERLSRLVHLAHRAHLLSHRLPQPAVGFRQLDLDLFHLHPRRAPHYRRPAPAGLAGADKSRPKQRLESGRLKSEIRGQGSEISLSVPGAPYQRWPHPGWRTVLPDAWDGNLTRYPSPPSL